MKGKHRLFFPANLLYGVKYGPVRDSECALSMQKVPEIRRVRQQQNLMIANRVPVKQLDLLDGVIRLRLHPAAVPDLLVFLPFILEVPGGYKIQHWP